MNQNGRAASNTRENPVILAWHFRKDWPLRAACPLCKSETRDVAGPRATGA